MENGNLISMVNHRISSLWHHHLTLTGQNRILNKAITLSNTVEDKMNGDSQSVVIYSNDGPSLNRKSNFVAQSFNTRDFCKNNKISCRIDPNNTRNTFCSHWMLCILKLKLWQKLIS